MSPLVLEKQFWRKNKENERRLPMPAIQSSLLWVRGLCHHRLQGGTHFKLHLLQAHLERVDGQLISNLVPHIFHRRSVRRCRLGALRAPDRSGECTTESRNICFGCGSSSFRRGHGLGKNAGLFLWVSSFACVFFSFHQHRCLKNSHRNSSNLPFCVA